ncbi:hypothetical protein CGJ94_17275 [Vibrio parahaemolyticus]|nr:hypothetical protein H058_00185 [Vibrio antiquarius]TOC16246.1 hypothetical protein CGJ94_17275 [Vibrio parahaemolyticus]
MQVLELTKPLAGLTLIQKINVYTCLAASSEVLFSSIASFITFANVVSSSLSPYDERHKK